MGIEIERKFQLKDKKVVSGLQGSKMAQGYLAQGPITVRVRLENTQAFLTVKGPTKGASRVECEYPIPLVDAQQMLALPGVARLSKTRFEVAHESHVYEIDQYHGHLEGLFTVEVELASADEQVSLPAWVGTELTGIRSWDNSALAQHGLPRHPEGLKMGPKEKYFLGVMLAGLVAALASMVPGLMPAGWLAIATGLLITCLAAPLLSRRLAAALRMQTVFEMREEDRQAH